MRFFENLFKGNNNNHYKQPNIPFGRYSDIYRTKKQYQAWEEALEAFEEGNYMTCYKHFFTFLRDDTEDNVRFWEDEKGLRFELLQGSKKVVGLADEERVDVEIKVAKVEKLEIEFMRQLMERNYTLKYGRFALDQNDDIVMKFNTYVLDGSPYKLYDALKEIATNSDKLDDLLLDEFEVLQPMETGHIQEIPQEEKNIKYTYICNWIRKTLDRLDKLEKTHPIISQAYLLMGLSYKLDYLIRPEGFMMESFERINRVYFAHDNQTLKQKCSIVTQELNTILNRPKTTLLKELYRTTTTFGVTLPVGHSRVVAFIDGEIGNMDWYINNNFHHTAIAIAEYIIGHCAFNYAIPKPDKELFHLFYQIIEPHYFKDLGFESDIYNFKKKTLKENVIRNQINLIVKNHKNTYPNLTVNVGQLNFDTLAHFSKTYLDLIRSLDYSENI